MYIGILPDLHKKINNNYYYYVIIFSQIKFSPILLKRQKIQK